MRKIATHLRQYHDNNLDVQRNTCYLAFSKRRIDSRELNPAITR